MDTVAETSCALGGIKTACDALGVSRATFYRRLQPKRLGPRRPTPRALKPNERTEVLATLNSERFVDQAPAQVHASLLEQGIYLCAVRTMYRILAANQQVKERRNQLRHPQYTKPELLATAPNELWSWDITKLKGPQKWTCFYLYVILDVFSRYVVGWMLADCESAQLAKRLVRETASKENIRPHQVSLHADRGSAMKSKALGNLLADLAITKTHSRPHVSNDNPFSESQFKTMKYRPEFPKRFGSMEDARTFCRSFFGWYNNDHHHSSLCFLTPSQVHLGQAEAVLEQRQRTLEAAFAAHPERFPNGSPRVQQLASEVWINPPQTVTNSEAADKPERDHVLIRETTRTNIEPLISLSLN